MKHFRLENQQIYTNFTILTEDPEILFIFMLQDSQNKTKHTLDKGPAFKIM